MPIVKMPDGQLVDMPDNPTQEQLSALSQIQSTSAEAAPSGMSESLKVLDKIVRGGVLAIPNLIKGLTGAVIKQQEDIDANGNLLEKALSLSAPGGIWLRAVNATPGAKELRAGMDKLMTPSEPETEVGKAIGNVGEAIVGTFVGPGGFAKPLQSLAIGAGSGVGSEVAGRLTDDNPIARIAGALTGGSIPAIASAVKPNAEKLIRQATEFVPKIDWKNAAMMKAFADDKELPNLSSQFLGSGSTLDDLMAVVASHPSIRPKLLARLETAPEKVRQALEAWKNENLPVSTSDTRMVMDDLQGAMAGKEREILNKANKAYTDALPPGTSEDVYTPDQVRAISKMLQARADDPAFHGPLAGGPFLTGIAKEIEDTIKSSSILDAAGEAMEQPVPKGYINNLLKSLNTRAEKEGFKGLPEADVKAIVKEATPEFAAAREAKAGVMRDELGPFQKSLAGQISQMGGGVRPDKLTAKDTALSWVFSRKAAQPEALRELDAQMGHEVTGELLREYITHSINSAVKMTAKGGNMQQPFEIVREMAGTPAQAENLKTMLGLAAKAEGLNESAVQNGFFKLMKTMESYGDLKIPSGVDKASLEQMAGNNAFGYLVAPQSRLGRSLWLKKTDKTFRRIADIVMSPNGLEHLQAIASSRNPSVLGRYVQSLLTEVNKIESDEQETN